ncbi:MAG: histidine kinase, partial [Proteobacteria bacterium]
LVVARLQNSQKEVLRSEKLASIGQLAAGTAHEIRNPLMSIKLLVQAALRDEGDDPLSRDDLTLIEREISRVEATVRNLLEFAKPQALNRKHFHVRELLDYCLSLVAGRAAIQGIPIRYDYSHEDVMAEGDFDQLHQVILNLLLNALDAMTNEGEILIRINVLSDQGEFLELSVDDMGVGIQGEKLGDMFEPFMSTKESGTGLGLSISKRIIEDHGGKMFAYNKSKGCTVGFRLPLHSI